jgi:hypothetical protein
MKNNFEEDFTHKLYKKKIEEIRKLHRSIAKFKKLYKIKNDDLDNLSDKRFKDIVDAYKRTHQIGKKNDLNSNKFNKSPVKKSRSINLEKKNEIMDINEILNDEIYFNQKSKDKKSFVGIRDSDKYKFKSKPSKFN